MSKADDERAARQGVEMVQLRALNIKAGLEQQRLRVDIHNLNIANQALLQALYDCQEQRRALQGRIEELEKPR